MALGGQDDSYSRNRLNNLIVLLDTNLSSWSKHLDGEIQSIHVLFDQILLFCNTFQNMSEYNRLCIIATGPLKSDAKFIYKQRMTIPPIQSPALCDTIRSAFVPQIGKEPSPFNSLSKALVLANCYANSLSISDDSNSRILIIQSSQEDPKDYILTMQSAFQAQKQNIAIDACRFSKSASALCLLHSISEMTGGSFSCIEKPQNLLFQLMFTFIMDPDMRNTMAQPDSIAKMSASMGSDSAHCYCHKKLIDIGYICPVCFAVYCQFIPVCRHCRTKFDIDILPSIKQRP